ncbi:nucleoside monophosphate kinase [Patescibacteria group bacterium]|nr:nucleoside monophosphate kinase [Patescibacteria group bacterium]
MNLVSQPHKAPETVIFIGPQGSGKGTQIERLDAHLRSVDPARKIADIQSGRKFRAFAADEEGYTADHIRETLNTGILQPLFLSVALWGTEMVHMVDPNSHVLIDGFPRAVPEAIVLETAFEFYKRENISVVFLDTPEEVVRQRMVARAREDDTADSIEERLSWYREKTLPVVEYYRDRPHTNLITIDGTKTVDEVSAEIIRALGYV